MTVASLIDYHRTVIAPDVRPRTLLEYAHSAEHIRKVLGADTPLGKVSLADAGRLKTYLTDTRGAKQGTVTKVVTHLKAMLAVAVRDGLLARNPLVKVKLRQAEPKEARIFSPEEVRRMAAAAPSPWWRMFVKLAFATGLRESELLTLRWQDIDTEAGEVLVRAKQAGTFIAHGREHPLLDWSAKSRSSYRSVPVAADVLAMLDEYRQQSDGSPYLFLSLERLRRIGRSMAAGKWRADTKLANNLIRDFHKVQRAAGLDEPLGTVHDLRKSFGTHTASVVPMPTLQTWMGHASIATTAKFYCRVRESDADKLRQSMADDQPLAPEPSTPKTVTDDAPALRLAV
jgi:integrase